LSASLIVRDEAAMLPDCLASLRDLVDEIVVVDTGSVDDTVEIAKSCGATIVHHRWSDDFAAARNVSLDHTTGEWVLYVDADERIEPGDHQRVRAMLADATEAAFRVLLKPSIDSTAYREYRLWRNDPRVRFEGAIHERVSTAIHRMAEQDGREIGLIDILIQHIGYEGDQTAKHHRNLPLLRRQLIDEPENLFVWHHLARVLAGLGEADESERVLEQAVAVATAQPHDEPLGVLVYAELVERRRARGAPVAELLAEAIASYPSNCVLWYLEGQVLTEASAYDDAIARFDRLLATDTNAFPPGSPSYDERLFGDLAHAGRALALFRAGRFADAADAYASAERLSPATREYTVKRQLAAARAAAAG
jgi:tetratricopeptide (TPR) repeat protein